ncbi:MAG TPA: radical SAM protein [Chloroflexia bacterium]|nr:radical SAM protein [Chloroflexia bacterium]
MFIPLTEIGRMGHQDKPSPLLARTLTAQPLLPQIHLFDTELGPHVLVVDGTRIYKVGSDVEAVLAHGLQARDSELVNAVLLQLGLDDTNPYITDEPLAPPPVRALSLAVAQKCNLGCTYCYADGGSFGSAPKQMSLETALAAVDLLFKDATPDDRVNLTFLGGEPLSNRALIRAATKQALRRAQDTGAKLSLSITTNGTLLTPEDGEFFEQHGFAVTISLDGIGASHDAQRPFKNGRGSYDRIIERIRPLLASQRQMQVSARVTVTPRNLDLPAVLDHFIDLGFHSVGFSPMLSSPTGQGEMQGDDLVIMLDQMIAAGQEFERHVIAGQRYPFLNMVNAMREIHKGTHRPYPCGAGAGYLGVSADGDLAACHRFVENEAGAMGNLSMGVDQQRQEQWLAERHVHRQEPCRSCWARYMCGGGCHHEVIQRGRPACDYIRGWLHYCLQAYIRLSEARPDYFGYPVAHA